MSNGQGVTSKAAFKVEKTTDWGTSTDCGAGDQIHFISESISHTIEQAQAIYKDGNVAAKNLYPIFKKYGGDLLIEAHYAGIESLIAVAMGASHQDLSPRAATTTTHEHFLELSEDMSTRGFNGLEMASPSGNASRRGTLCFEKTISVWELASGMINAMSFEASPERVTFSFTVAGRTITFDSATNPNSTSWALPTDTEQIVWDDMTVYLKPRDLFTIQNTVNDQINIDEGGGDVLVDIFPFVSNPHTGYELAQLIATRLNASGSLSGDYRAEYDEVVRRFRIYTVNGQTFSVSGVAMNMATTIGMTVDSPTALNTWSDSLPVADSFAAFASGDKVGVSKVTVAHENILDIESQDSESDLYILEPERNGFRRITGTFEIPRYKNDDFLKAVNGFTTYMLWVNFTGSAIDSENYELNFYLPSIKFSNTEAPIAGAELIKQTLSWEAESPNVIDLVNFAFPNFLAVESDTITEDTLCTGAGPDGLYIGCTAGLIYTWDELTGDFTSSTDVGTASIGALHPFGSNMYAGGQGGEVWEQADGLWSLSTDIGSGIMVKFQQYGSELFVLERDTGAVYYYPDGDTSWSLSTDTTATDANVLEAYGGSLFMAGSDGASFTRVYEYSGGAHLTGWSLNCDFGGAGTTHQTSCVHEGKLYVATGSSLFAYSGGGSEDWIHESANIGINVQWMSSWKGHIIMIPTGASADFYYYDFSTGSAVNVFPDLNLGTGRTNQVHIGDTVFLPQSDTTMHMVKAMKEMAITIKNQNSANPL